MALGYSISRWRSWAIDLLLVSPFPKEGGVGFLLCNTLWEATTLLAPTAE